MNIPELHQRIKKLAEAATPGPWIEAGNGCDNLDSEGKPIKYDSVFYDRPDDLDDYEAVCRDTTHEDSMFIAAANPQAILQMIAVMEQMADAMNYTILTGEGLTELDHALAAYKELMG